MSRPVIETAKAVLRKLYEKNLESPGDLQPSVTIARELGITLKEMELACAYLDQIGWARGSRAFGCGDGLTYIDMWIEAPGVFQVENDFPYEKHDSPTATVQIAQSVYGPMIQAGRDANVGSAIGTIQGSGPFQRDLEELASQIEALRRLSGLDPEERLIADRHMTQIVNELRAEEPDGLKLANAIAWVKHNATWAWEKISPILGRETVKAVVAHAISALINGLF